MYPLSEFSSAIWILVTVLYTGRPKPESDLQKTELQGKGIYRTVELS